MTLIIGTTGFSNKQESFIKKASKKIAILKSGNMSLGINLIEYITRNLSKKIPNNLSLFILLGLAIFTAVFFSSAVKAQSVAVSWLDDSDLLASELNVPNHR